MRTIHSVGARPNFMKVAPVVRALREYPGVRQTVAKRSFTPASTYDFSMSDVFFQELGITPDINLQVGSGSHAQQTAEIVRRFDPVVPEQKPDLVLMATSTRPSQRRWCVKLLVEDKRPSSAPVREAYL
jgi:UDP-N-acetylglucosamine 2-epimerase (non-hydrolysing)